jgi:hypothetical protein
MTSNIAIMRPPARAVTVVDSPTVSTISAPMTKPVMLPKMATLVTQPAAVARTRVGKSSERWAASAGVSIPRPIVAKKIAGARIHPLSWV